MILYPGYAVKINPVNQARYCYDKKRNIIEKISTRLQWICLLGLVEIVVDQKASLPPCLLIGQDGGFNVKIMRVG